ncbi:hypothetical protein KSS87_015675 [Heliosperma pusillum]|nr:hypothetical protein KSS87_015675 [Heliosperma pusillum]
MNIEKRLNATRNKRLTNFRLKSINLRCYSPRTDGENELGAESKSLGVVDAATVSPQVRDAVTVNLRRNCLSGHHRQYQGMGTTGLGTMMEPTSEELTYEFLSSFDYHTSTTPPSVEFRIFNRTYSRSLTDLGAMLDLSCVRENVPSSFSFLLP